MKTLREQIISGELSDEAKEFVLIMTKLSDEDVMKMAGFIDAIVEQSIRTFKVEVKKEMIDTFDSEYEPANWKSAIRIVVDIMDKINT